MERCAEHRIHVVFLKESDSLIDCCALVEDGSYGDIDEDVLFARILMDLFSLKFKDGYTKSGLIHSFNYEIGRSKSSGLAGQ